MIPVIQKDHYTCGPVALMNALRWLNIPFKYRKARKEFIAAMRCTKKDGTYTDEFGKVFKEKIRMVGSAVIVRHSVDGLLWWLEKGYGAAVYLKWKYLGTGHYIWVEGIVNINGLNYFIIHNWVAEYARLVSEVEMRKQEVVKVWAVKPLKQA